MAIKLGVTIAAQRKQKGVTQQALADFLGVSKAAVSKWETGQTYPDISLLPLLAAYFDISIDALLRYDSQLSDQEIRRIYKLLKQAIQEKEGSEVWTMLQNFLHRYYACYPFVLQMGLFILNHYDLFPEVAHQDKATFYMQTARRLFIHVHHNTKSPELINQARSYEAYTLLILKRPDDVLQMLGEYVPAYFPTETLIAGAFQQKQASKRADMTLQCALAQYVFVMMSLLTNYLKLLEQQPDKFLKTYQKGHAIAEIFRLAQLHPVILLNFQAMAIIGFAKQQQTELLFTVLTDFVDLLSRTDFKAPLHGDGYFDQIEGWLAQLDLGRELPRNGVQVQAGMLALVKTHPALAPYRKMSEFQPILEKIKQIGVTDNE